MEDRIECVCVNSFLENKNSMWKCNNFSKIIDDWRFRKLSKDWRCNWSKKYVGISRKCKIKNKKSLDTEIFIKTKRGCVSFPHLSPRGIASDSQGWKQKGSLGF